MATILDQKRSHRWSSDFGEVAFLHTDRGFEMHRERCPHHQCWLVLKGTWSENSSEGRNNVRPGEFRAYRPLEQNVRVAEEDTFQIGFRMFVPQRPGFEWPTQRLLWQMAHSLINGTLDELGFDEAITHLQPPAGKCEMGETDWLRKSRAIIHEKPESLTLKTLADQVGISPNHLCTSFRKVYGVSVSHYRRRLLLAQSLRDGGTLNPIQHGFYDASHFHRVCLAELGLSPKQLTAILSQS